MKNRRILGVGQRRGGLEEDGIHLGLKTDESCQFGFGEVVQGFVEAGLIRRREGGVGEGGRGRGGREREKERGEWEVVEGEGEGRREKEGR
jgi:hypothetical protein